jgi:hypothetical protein
VLSGVKELRPISRDESEDRVIRVLLYGCHEHLEPDGRVHLPL